MIVIKPSVPVLLWQ